jgi:GNAT superfamily N-acetyltransferase
LEEIKIITRDFIPDLDQAMIYSSWRNQSYYSAEKKIEGSPTRFFAMKSQQIRDILIKANVKIACLEDDPSTIIGYCVNTGSHLNWVYVKPDYRLQGIAKLLVPKDTQTVSSDLTKTGAKIVEMKKLKKENDHGRNSEDRQTH